MPSTADDLRVSIDDDHAVMAWELVAALPPCSAPAKRAKWRVAAENGAPHVKSAGPWRRRVAGSSGDGRGVVASVGRHGCGAGAPRRGTPTVLTRCVWPDDVIDDRQ